MGMLIQHIIYIKLVVWDRVFYECNELKLPKSSNMESMGLNV
jgi:hypothetical protein